MGINRNLRITISDYSEEQNGITTPAAHLTTSEDGESIMVDALANRFSLSLKDLKEAIAALEDFSATKRVIEVKKDQTKVIGVVNHWEYNKED